MSVVAWLLAVAGFTALALSMDRHHRDVFGALPTPKRRRGLRAVGWAAVLASVTCCIVGWGVAYGVIAGLGVMAAAAAPPLFWLSYRTAPRARPSPGAPPARAPRDSAS
ncbi:DUF3325 domain-containing protein [Stenotrophomonas sp.]|uniref:DUF3325 domain-containing protein n=1 Tax=Stenotrophomonas sp. TaxID=69392 RepID=UPI0028ACFCB7|nr:DUF3325 domain-containing protein [Stenotrophomonas sp.]